MSIYEPGTDRSSVLSSGSGRSRKEAGLYIHIPFCRSKCSYCDFNSYPSMEEHIPGYLTALKRELSLYSSRRNEISIRSIFIGGGTPSLLTGSQVKDMLQHTGNCLYIKEDAEITIESNPGTLDTEKLEKYRGAGANRLSVGLQAWQDGLLEQLGRIHTKNSFVNNYKAARASGFTNINIDLIFGIPGQTVEEWKETLEQVAELAPEHLSCYSLKIEEGTVFGELFENGQLSAVEDETDREMYWWAVEYLTGLGYKHYEISNFAQEGFECRHNLIYWKADEYIGAGAGAHSYLDGERWENEAAPRIYVKSLEKGDSPAVNRQIINSSEAMSEFMILGLRLIQGVSAEKFYSRFGIGLEEVYGKQIEELIKQGLLKRKGNTFSLSSRGLDLANSVFVEFI